MKFDENLAAVHAYLCADGYVIKNPPEQKQKYYKIGFRNTNLILLKDFKKRFNDCFGIEPILRKGERCYLGNKSIYNLLTKEFGSFYSWEWRMPELNVELSKIWLRAYFDCEAWVFCKSHQNRHIGIDCVNEKGLNQVIFALNKLKIEVIKKENKKRKIFRILIYGKENLIKFNEKIGFLHPDKKEKLNQVLNDFVVYEWKFPKDEKECKKFIKKILEEKTRIKKPHYIRIFSREEINLINLSRLLNFFYNVECIVSKRINGIGTIYYELNINRKEEIQKLINKELIPNILK